MRGKAAERALRAAPALLVAAGLAILAWYPASEAWDAYRNAQALQAASGWSTASDTAEEDDERNAELLAQAQAYNALLAGEDPAAFGVAADEVWDYGDQLSADGHDTAIGSVVVPSLSLTVSLYAGTSDAALSAGVGHLESSSLPVGGASTHAVVCGHSGASGARCFDDLDQLEVGDVFAFVVLGEVLAYRVTSVEVVLPEEVESLAIVEGADLATLITCTPYGVNDHRLLVHAERCEPTEELLAYLGRSAEESAVASTLASGRLLPFAAATLAVTGGGCLGCGLRKGRRRQARRRARKRIRGRMAATTTGEGRKGWQRKMRRGRPTRGWGSRRKALRRSRALRWSR